MNNRIALVAGLVLAASSAGAGEVTIVDARAEAAGDGTYTFRVTLAHDDTGWDHYADRWEVLGPEGEVLGTRVLAHPHETEQPFTRSLTGVVVPDGVREVAVRAHDKVHGDGPELFTVELPGRPGAS